MLLIDSAFFADSRFGANYQLVRTYQRLVPSVGLTTLTLCNLAGRKLPAPALTMLGAEQVIDLPNLNKAEDIDRLSDYDWLWLDDVSTLQSSFPDRYTLISAKLAPDDGDHSVVGRFAYLDKLQNLILWT